MDECIELTFQVVNYVLGIAMDDDERRAAAAHLVGCAECRSRQHFEDVLQLGHPLPRARAALNVGER